MCHGPRIGRFGGSSGKGKGADQKERGGLCARILSPLFSHFLMPEDVRRSIGYQEAYGEVRGKHFLHQFFLSPPSIARSMPLFEAVACYTVVWDRNGLLFTFC